MFSDTRLEKLVRRHRACLAPGGQRPPMWTGILVLLAVAAVGCIDDDSPSRGADLSKAFSAGTTVDLSATPLADLDTTQATTWTAAELVQGFRTARDERRFLWSSQPSFARRPSFLYPDGGCNVRAKLMNEGFAADGHVPTTNVWLFGDLRIDTSNLPRGWVTWSFHVAPIVQVDGEPWVIDPSIDPAAPLALADWIAMQVIPEDLYWARIAICDTNMYSTDDPCHGTTPDWPLGQDDQDKLFAEEWIRQGELGRDPSQVLGDAPPWL